MRSILNILKIPLRVLNDFVLFFITYMPGITGRKLRYFYWSKRFKKCGKNVIIDEGVIIQGAEWISIGDNVWIDKYCILIAGPVKFEEKDIVKKRSNKNFKLKEGELYISDNVHIAPFCIIQAHSGVYIGLNCGFSSGVKIYSLSNLPNNPTNKKDIVFFSPIANKVSYFSSPVVINENTGVALNSIILPGVTIGVNSFITPNSVVMTDIPENSYASGYPAKKIRDRFNLEDRVNEG